MRINSRSSWVFRNGYSLLAAITGFVLVYLFTRHSGVGISPDSVTYLSVASHIHDRGAWMDFHGDPLIDFPGFYPLFLAIVQWVTGMQTLRSAPVLNGLLFAGLIFFCGWLMRESLRSKFCRWALLILIVTSPCLLEVYTMLWSETLFLLLVLLFFYLLGRYFQTLSIRVLIVAGLIAGLSFVTRYAGITLLLTGALLLFRHGKKIRPILLFGSCASLLPLINLIHNGLTGGAPIGHRESGLVSFGTNLHDLGTLFCDWLHIPNNHYLLASAIGSGWIGLFVLAFLFRWVHGIAHIAVTYFIVYALFILLSATFSRFQPLDSRLLSPLFIPWLWGSAALLSEWMDTRAPSRSSFRRKMLLLPMILLVAALLTGQGLTDRGNWEDQRDSGVPGYTDDDWRGSPTMAALQKNGGILPSGLYSNAYDAIWFLGGIRAGLLPHKEDRREQNSLLAKDSLCIVWFNDGVNPDLVDIAWISRYKKLYSQQPFDDGAIYFFTGKLP